MAGLVTSTMLMDTSIASSSPRESSLLPGPGRGWLLAFVLAGLLSFLVTSFASPPLLRGFVSGAAFIVQLVAFLKVLSLRSARA